MRSVFRTTFNLKLQHNYYADGRCMDFSVFPVDGTGAVLKRHDAVFRTFDNNVRLFILANAANSTAGKPFDRGCELFFGMHLNNSSFLNFTSEQPPARKVFLYTNKGAVTSELTRRQVAVSGSLLSHTITTNQAVTLALKDSTDTVLERKEYKAGFAGHIHCFDLRMRDPGLYTVAEDSSAVNTEYYVSDTMASANIFGLIQIVNLNLTPFTYDGNTEYKISFTASSSKWTYYVVAPGFSAAELQNLLEVSHAVQTGMTEIKFDKTYPVPPADPFPSLIYKDTAKVAMFVSKNAITFRQSTIKKLELKKNNTVLITDLPNPDVTSGKSTMFITI